MALTLEEKQTKLAIERERKVRNILSEYFRFDEYDPGSIWRLAAPNTEIWPVRLERQIEISIDECAREIVRTLGRD